MRERTVSGGGMALQRKNLGPVLVAAAVLVTGAGAWWWFFGEENPIACSAPRVLETLSELVNKNKAHVGLRGVKGDHGQPEDTCEKLSQRL